MSKIILTEQTAPDTPASGKVVIYPKTDGLLYQKDDAGTETVLAYTLETHASNHTDGTDDIQDATALQKGLATSTQITKLDGIEEAADVTDATNVNAAGAVMESDYNANTILAATSDNTPVTLEVAEQTIVGRITAGEIDALTATEVRTLLNVEDGAEANNISDANATDLTDGGDTTLHDHDGISENTSARHTQGTDVALGAVGTKDPPIDADLAIYRDSTASDALVTSTWAQIKAFLKTYFDTFYNLYVHPNHSGDVTSVADGAQTISNGAVTYAKIQNVVNDERILGRVSGAGGDVEELTKTQVLTMINVADGADVTGSNAPQAHAASHKSGGSDDLLSAPGTIGGTTPAAGAFTDITLNAISSLTAASNTDIDTGTETVDSFADTLGDGCVWHYVVKNGANLRTGTVMAAWDATGDTVAYSEMSSGDVGTTSGLVFSVDISSNTVRLRATAGSNNWSVKVTRILM